MRLHNMVPFRPLPVGLALMSISLATFADALSQTYCSTQNTGSDFSVVNDIYQSNGACHDTCNSQSYALAIVQYQNCWCSNYLPASQDDVSNCSEDCPGYPDEQCGDKDTGYFGYIQLGTPLGTAGGSSSSSQPEPSSTAPSTTEQPSSTPEPSSTQDPATSYVSTTIEKTVTPSQSQSVIVSYVTPSTSKTPTPIAPVTTSKTSSSTVHSTTEMSATPVTSVIMTTISGDVVTQTVTTTPMVAPGSHSDQIPLEAQHQGLGSGAIAGIVIGVLAGIALIGAAAFLLWRRKRNDGDAENGGSGPKKGMSRNVSVLSKAGLLARTRTSMGERDNDDSCYVTPPTGQNSVRHSMLFTGAEGVSPVSPLDSSHSNGSGKSARDMVYDQRLNPSALFANHENGSRISMQDQQDYSRPLGIANPDPRASFDSRFSRG